MFRFPSVAVICIACVVASAAILAEAHAEDTLRTFHIGNSLTWDARPTAFSALSSQVGLDHEVGHHIRCGKSLPWIVKHPDQLCYENDHGTWPTALSEFEWDVVTLQLAPSDGSTLSADVQAATTLIDAARMNPANDDTRFVVYGAWPDQIQGGYEEQWLADVDAEDDATPTSYSRAYHRAAFDRLVKERPDTRLSLFSNGELFYLAHLEIESAKERGEPWLGFSEIYDMYLDQWHLNGVGRWLASLGMWKAVTGADPTGLVRPVDVDHNPFNPLLDSDIELRDGLSSFVEASFASIFWGEAPGIYTPNADCSLDGKIDASDLHCVDNITERDIILDVLKTLPGDLDGDGDVGFGDFLTLRAHFGSEGSYAQGNINLRNGVNFVDFVVLADNYRKTPSAVASIPEPTGAFLVLLGLPFLIPNRRNRSRPASS